MLIFRGGNWPEHRPWFLATTALAAAAVVWYGIESSRAGGWPGGASQPGLVFGTAGGLIIVFEMLLWPRKKFRAARVGRAKLWLKAHVWLGLLSLPLLVLHSGFRWWGGPLASALMLVLLAVIASGVWGLALQQFLPKLMLEHVPAETIRSQIDYILAQFLEEAERAVRETCGLEEVEREGAGATAARRHAEKDKAFLVVGAVRATGPVQGKSLQTRPRAQRVAGSEPLLALFEKTVAPYLRARNGSGLPLGSAKRAGLLFERVRNDLDPAAHGVVNLLENLCEQRRQFDLQARLHAWLHAWLCVHLPLSVFLLLLMIAHVYWALRYF